MADDQSSRQYLTLSLAGERFALESLAVSEVIDLLPITWVPLGPESLGGVVNLRGNAATVVDLHRLLDLPENETAKNTCLIIMEREYDGETLAVAALADAVHEVVEIAPADIVPPPEMGLSVPARFVKGLAPLEGTFVMILDADRLLSLEELGAGKR